MKYLIILALLAGCRNEAISYAKMIDPRVKCNAVATGAFGSSGDTAVCVLRGKDTKVWSCAAQGPAGFPVCIVAATYSPEAQ